jgi:NAD-dependent dihydropyrimidine dehydrogenase PreA subunit
VQCIEQEGIGREIDADVCVDCGACQPVCPVDAIIAV